MRKRLLSFVLAVLMIASLLPAAVLAADIVDSGTCGAEGDGSNLTWTLDSKGALTIRGTGEMAHYGKNYRDACLRAPWPTDIKTVTIENGVTSIGGYAFYSCEELAAITIPDSVRYIGEYAFLNCESLKEIELPEQLVRIGAGAFRECRELEHIEIPEFVDEIESDTFRRCESLTEIKIPWGVSFIDRYAFAECRNLSKIVLPETIGEIEYNAFSGVRATVCYPSDSRGEEWIGKDYSGTLIWQAVEPEE